MLDFPSGDFSVALRDMHELTRDVHRFISRYDQTADTRDGLARTSPHTQEEEPAADL